MSKPTLKLFKCVISLIGFMIFSFFVLILETVKYKVVIACSIQHLFRRITLLYFAERIINTKNLFFVWSLFNVRPIAGRCPR